MGSEDLLAYANKYSFKVDESISAYTIAKIPLTSLVNKKNRFYATRDAIDLLGKLLIYDHKQRITAKDAMNHPYFQHNHLFKHFIDHHQQDNYSSTADFIPIDDSPFQLQHHPTSPISHSSSSNQLNDDEDKCTELASINTSYSKRFWDYSLVQIHWSDESRYRRVLKIGRGYFGEVYLGRRTDSRYNTSYVIKVWYGR